MTSAAHEDGAAAIVVGGLTPLSTTDWPGMLAATVFCQGCAWNCPYCHNAALRPFGLGERTWPEVLAWLTTRRGLLDAVVFSGGEPTLQSGLPEAIAAVRALGFKVGLHSAGMYPERLAPLLPLIDWIGLDVKAQAADYPRITGVPGSGEKAWESLRRVLDSGIAHQLRCTWSPALYPQTELDRLRETLFKLGTGELVVQPCRPARPPVTEDHDDRSPRHPSAFSAHRSHRSSGE